MTKKLDPAHRAWEQMIARCENPSSTRKEHYVDRGITICRRWRKSFDVFLADMGPRPSAKHSLDRKNNNGNYTPKNCQWATATQQGNNKRNNRRYRFRGKMLTIRQMIEAAGSTLDPRTVWARLNIYGWPIERAMTDAPGSYKSGAST